MKEKDAISLQELVEGQDEAVASFIHAMKRQSWTLERLSDQLSAQSQSVESKEKHRTRPHHGYDKDAHRQSLLILTVPSSIHRNFQHLFRNPFASIWRLTWIRHSFKYLVFFASRSLAYFSSRRLDLNMDCRCLCKGMTTTSDA